MLCPVLVCSLLIYFELKDHDCKCLQTYRCLDHWGQSRKKSEIQQPLLSNFITLTSWKDKTRMCWNSIPSEGRNWKQEAC